MSKVAYEVRGLAVRYGSRQIVSQVDLEVRAGEVLALVGPNGAGKSTILGALSGDVSFNSGTVKLNGQDLASWRPRDLARTRAVLMQSNQVSFPFTVREVVEMGRNPWVGHASEAEDDEAIAEAIELSDVGHLVDRPFTALSGGEKARVSLARVLAQRTEVVLLDEPTAALDLRHQEEVMEMTRKLAAAGRAVAVVLHDLTLAAARADRIAMVAGGELVAVGTPREVLTAERVAAVYGIEVHVIDDRPGGHLIVVPHRL